MTVQTMSGRRCLKVKDNGALAAPSMTNAYLIKTMHVYFIIYTRYSTVAPQPSARKLKTMRLHTSVSSFTSVGRATMFIFFFASRGARSSALSAFALARQDSLSHACKGSPRHTEADCFLIPIWWVGSFSTIPGVDDEVYMYCFSEIRIGHRRRRQCTIILYFQTSSSGHCLKQPLYSSSNTNHCTFLFIFDARHSSYITSFQRAACRITPVMTV